MKLSKQAVACLMIALQEAILEQKDIVPILENFDFIADGEDSDSQLVVANPPTTLKASMTELV